MAALYASMVDLYDDEAEPWNDLWDELFDYPPEHPTYPMPAKYKNEDDIAIWMEKLPRVGVTEIAEDTGIAWEDDKIVELPCRCHVTCGSLREHLDPFMGDHDSCPMCGFQLFVSVAEFDSNAWIQDLESVNMTELEDADQGCGICRREYTDPSHYAHDSDESDRCVDPVKLPCNHIFGKVCIGEWLSPTEGEGRTCPMCRRVLFEPRPSADMEGSYDHDIPNLENELDDFDFDLSPEERLQIRIEAQAEALMTLSERSERRLEELDEDERAEFESGALALMDMRTRFDSSSEEEVWEQTGYWIITWIATRRGRSNAEVHPLLRPAFSL